jgi:hypothetical protein
MLSITSAPIKLKNAFKESKDKRFHWPFKVNGKNHILCIKTIKRNANLFSCRIAGCDCERDENDKSTYKCKYYSRMSVNIKKDDLVYPCGCGKAMWSVLDAMLKQAGNNKGK